MEPQEFTRGENAFNDGVPISSNPYPWGSWDQANWARGWKAAETAKRKKFYDPKNDVENEDNDIPF